MVMVMVVVLVVVVGKVIWWFVVLKQECYVAQANLDLAIQGDFRFWIFSPQPPACWDEHSPSRWDDRHVLLHTVLHAVTGMYFYTQSCRIRLQACATTCSPVCWGDRHVLLHTVFLLKETQMFQNQFWQSEHNHLNELKSIGSYASNGWTMGTWALLSTYHMYLTV